MLQQFLCPDVRDLEHFDLGNLTDDEADILERHLAECAHCVHTLETLHGRDTLIDAMRAQNMLSAQSTTTEPVQTLIQRLKNLCSSELAGGEIPTTLDRTPRPAALLGRVDYSFLAPPQEPDEMGRLGAYRILRVLGVGGMGIVFQAEDSQLHRLVALKVLHPAWAKDPSARRRFLREGQAAAAIAHDNLVPIYHVGEDRGVPFLAMQLLEGETLESRWRRVGKIAPDEVWRIGREIASGLAAAHQCGLIHRDIKPANIWLETCSSPHSGDRVKILDFGLARAAEDDVHLTDPGVFVGTPLWVAPEQADGNDVDCRSDLFSLGSVLYALCTGQPPFRAETSLGVLRRVCDSTPQPVHESDPEVPIELSAIIAKLHAKDPADRYQSAAEVAAALGSRGRNNARRHGSYWWLVAAAASVFAIGGLTFTESTGVTQVGSMFAALFDIPDNKASTRDSAVDADKKTQSPAPPAPSALGEKAQYPTAVFTFEERAVAKGYGAQVSDLLFAKLAAMPAFVLVERNDLSKILEEQALSLSGLVNSNTSTRVGQLTGAKILISGSVFKVDKKLLLVARIVGAETSQVLGASAEGAASDDLERLVEKLANKVADTITQKAAQLVAPVMEAPDRIKALNAQLKDSRRPTLWMNITERHVGQARPDPAAQTELTLFCQGCAFPVIDAVQGSQGTADILITGEGISEFAARHGNLVSVKARVELKAVERRSGKVLAVDRQTALVADLTEQIAAKTALQEAAAILAERLLPKLVKR